MTDVNFLSRNMELDKNINYLFYYEKKQMDCILVACGGNIAIV